MTKTFGKSKNIITSISEKFSEILVIIFFRKMVLMILRAKIVQKNLIRSNSIFTIMPAQNKIY